MSCVCVFFYESETKNVLSSLVYVRCVCSNVLYIFFICLWIPLFFFSVHYPILAYQMNAFLYRHVEVPVFELEIKKCQGSRRKSKARINSETLVWHNLHSWSLRSGLARLSVQITMAWLGLLGHIRVRTAGYSDPFKSPHLVFRTWRLSVCCVLCACGVQCIGVRARSTQLGSCCFIVQFDFFIWAPPVILPSQVLHCLWLMAEEESRSPWLRFLSSSFSHTLQYNTCAS